MRPLPRNARVATPPGGPGTGRQSRRVHPGLPVGRIGIPAPAAGFSALWISTYIF